MGELLKFDPIAQRLSAVPARARMDELISAEDAQERVRAMDAFGLYSLIRDVGVADALELIHLASAEQSQAFLDFDCWTRDSLDLEKVGDWLSVLFQTEDEGMVELQDGLDPEVLGLYLRSHLRVYFYEDEDDAEIIENLQEDYESSPDGVYAIVFPDDPETASQVRLILHRLYFTDHMAARQLLYQARWEMNSVLEDNAYRVRSGRLEQFGFLPVDEAVAIYAATQPATERKSARRDLSEPETVDTVLTSSASAAPAELPAAVARELEGVSAEDGTFFGRAYRQAMVGQPTAFVDGLVRQLATLVNTAVMADLVEPGDTDSMPWVFRRVHGFLNIGLSYLADDDLDAATRLLRLWPLKRVLRTGYSLTAKVAHQAAQLRSRGNLSLVDELPYSLCTDAEGDLIEGLLQIRPLRSMTYSEGFETLAEIEEAAATLASLAFKELWTFGLRQHQRGELAQLFFGAAPAATAVEAITFDSLLATHSAVRLLEGTGHLRLLTTQDLATLFATHISPDGLSPEFAAAIEDSLRAPTPAAQETTARLAARWRDEISAALVEEYGRLDPSAAREAAFLPHLLIPAGDPDSLDGTDRDLQGDL